VKTPILVRKMRKITLFEMKEEFSSNVFIEFVMNGM
jgi:hypothetical protein